ncbi:hypothetical protein QOZ80_2AG0115600 [Eleusine coracana subsp. coracana]|nr:hypothetical protein QOZ80_2AG0115600 [Eleusine coracana subsp. coracana]
MASSSQDVKEIDAPPKRDSPVSCDGRAGDGIHWAEEVAKMTSMLRSVEEFLKLCCGINNEKFMPFCANEGCGPCTLPPEGSNALAPNIWRYMVGFVLMCQAAEVTPMAAVFRHYFMLKAHKDLGFYYFAPYQTNRLLFKHVSLPSNDGWRKKFFFLEARSSDQPWRCPKEWGTPSKAACNRPEETEAVRTAIRKLEEKALKDDVMGLLVKSRVEDKLPVRSGLPALVKLEASVAAEEKHRSMAAVTNPQLQVNDVPAASSSALIPPGAERGEFSTSQLFIEACHLAKKTEAELQRVKDELRVEKAKHARDIAQLDRELGAARAEHASKVAQLTKKLEAEKIKHAGREKDLLAAEEEYRAEVARLADELQAEKTERAGQVAQLVEALKITKAKLLHKVHQIQVTETERDKALQLAPDQRVKNINILISNKAGLSHILSISTA